MDRVYYSYADLLSELGGLFTSLFAIFSLFGNLMNRHFIMYKVTRAIYSFTNDDHEGKDSPYQDISTANTKNRSASTKKRFSYFSAIYKMLRAIRFLCPCRRIRRDENMTV